MKSIVLGIMIASGSVSFAQTDAAPTHQLKNKFSAKQQMVVKPAAAEVSETAQRNQKVEIVALSRSNVKSSVTQGVIRIEKGTPYIVLKSGNVERKMIPMNLPKKMAVNGQEIQFTYTVVDAEKQNNSKETMKINLYDVAVSPRK